MEVVESPRVTPARTTLECADLNKTVVVFLCVCVSVCFSVFSVGAGDEGSTGARLDGRRWEVFVCCINLEASVHMF